MTPWAQLPDATAREIYQAGVRYEDARSAWLDARRSQHAHPATTTRSVNGRRSILIPSETLAKLRELLEEVRRRQAEWRRLCDAYGYQTCWRIRNEVTYRDATEDLW